MGYDLTRFKEEVDEELLCSICSGVLQDPLQAPECEHSFCSACIKEWLSRQPVCPVDRQPVTIRQLRPPPRILRNLLHRLSIDCEHTSAGCTTIVKLDYLSSHSEECHFNPKKLVPCESGCGSIVPKDELKDHNCIKSLRTLVNNQEETIVKLTNNYESVKRELNKIKDYLRVLRDSNPNNFSDIFDTFEHDEVTRWVQNLPLARVTRWGCMISTPDVLLQEGVRKGLIDSGCPGHLVTELMDNSHERRWPIGLCALETRQMNRRLYDQYVCRRITGRQAVVVMSCDNPHMNEDMLLDPGLVMIFAHGVE